MTTRGSLLLLAVASLVADAAVAHAATSRPSRSAQVQPSGAAASESPPDLAPIGPPAATATSDAQTAAEPASSNTTAGTQPATSAPTPPGGPILAPVQPPTAPPLVAAPSAAAVTAPPTAPALTSPATAPSVTATATGPTVTSPASAPTLTQKATAPVTLVRFRGNLALSDEVYLAVLQLPPAFKVDAETAAAVRVQTLTFLQRAGYELARVEAAVEGDHILVDVDEGRVEKLVLRGQGSLRTIQLILAISLPHNVFNRPYLDRKLADLKSRLGVDVAGYELVKTSEVAHVGPQISDLGPLTNQLGMLREPLLPPHCTYELHILFRRRDWGQGFGLSAGLGGADGLRLGVDYKGESLLFDGDRWATRAQAGANIRHRIDTGDTYVALTRAVAGLDWYTPPFGPSLRPALSLRGDLRSRQRPDIGLEHYTLVRFQAGPGIGYQLRPSANLDVALDVRAGVEQRELFSLELVDTAMKSDDVQRTSAFQTFVGSELKLTFDRDEVRRDRHHRLELDSIYYPIAHRAGYGLASYDYKKVFAFGWHDLLLTSRGAYLWGQVPFVEEEPVGGPYVRGVFGDKFFTRRVVSGGLEFRWSLTRDVYKLSFYTEGALFGAIDRLTGQESLRGMLGAGAGFHALVADAFQVNIYYGVGYAGKNELDKGFTVGVEQAF